MISKTETKRGMTEEMKRRRGKPENLPGERIVCGGGALTEG
jgi:hypothetical protein